MAEDVWVHGAVFALALAQLFVFWYLYRRSGLSSTHEGGRQTAGAAGDTGGATAGEVTCPTCGAVNATRFRFCRNCTDELPRSTRGSRANGSP